MKYYHNLKKANIVLVFLLSSIFCCKAQNCKKCIALSEKMCETCQEGFYQANHNFSKCFKCKIQNCKSCENVTGKCEECISNNFKLENGICNEKILFSESNFIWAFIALFSLLLFSICFFITYQVFKKLIWTEDTVSNKIYPKMNQSSQYWITNSQQFIQAKTQGIYNSPRNFKWNTKRGRITRSGFAEVFFKKVVKSHIHKMKLNQAREKKWNGNIKCKSDRIPRNNIIKERDDFTKWPLRKRRASLAINKIRRRSMTGLERSDIFPSNEQLQNGSDLLESYLIEKRLYYSYNEKRSLKGSKEQIQLESLKNSSSVFKPIHIITESPFSIDLSLESI